MSYSSELSPDLGEDLENRARRLVLHLHQLIQLLGDLYPVHLQGETLSGHRGQHCSSRQKSSLVHTYSKDPLGLASCTHVGVVDMFENHPGLIVFAHLRRRGGRLRLQTQRHTLSFRHNFCNSSVPGVCLILETTSKKYVCQMLVIILLLPDWDCCQLPLCC